MSLHLRVLGGTLLCATLIGAVPVHAQTRFALLSREAISASLQVITIRDAAANSCYLLFVVDVSQPASRRTLVQPADVAAAAERRDRSLAELSHIYEQSFGSQFVGTPANVLPYQFEAQKIQSDFEHVLREQEFARMEEQLELLSLMPKVAVSGPASCGGADHPTATTGR